MREGRAAGQAIPAYFINLDRDTARRSFMEEQFARHGLALQRIPAIDGRKLSESEVAALRHPVGTHQLAPAEMACNLSHLEAWKRAAESNSPFTAIFEDDVLISDDFDQYLISDKWIPNRTDLVKIETILEPTRLGRHEVRVNGRSLSRLMGAHLGAGAYIISRDCAKRLISQPRRWGSLVDHALFNPEYTFVRGARTWQMLPSACVQQVKHTERFLPEGAPDSNLIDYRLELSDPRFQPKKKATGSKFWRELTRPARRFRLYSSETLIPFFTQTRTVTIPFRK